MSPNLEVVQRVVDGGMLFEASARMAAVVVVGLLAIGAVSYVFRRWDP